MPTLKASLRVPHQEEATRIADLLEAAFLGEETPIAFFEDLSHSAWMVEAYREGTDPDAFAQQVKDALGSDAFGANLECQILEDKDWVTASLEGLDAVRVARFVVHGIHARSAVGPTDHGIQVEASRAFGSGHHGTTLGCLELIDWHCARQPPRHVLDVGTGTGVLAMASALVSKANVVASDIDPIAVEIARSNVRINHLKPWIRVACADGTKGAPSDAGPYDLIIANILAGPLIDLALPLSRLLTPHGAMILSGLMHRQERAVRARYRAHGLVTKKRCHRQEWSALYVQRSK